MLEIILIQESSIFHALSVDHVSADGVIAKDSCGPLSKLCGSEAVYTVAYCDDGIETIKVNLLRDFSTEASFYDYFHFGNSRVFL